MWEIERQPHWHQFSSTECVSVWEAAEWWEWAKYVWISQVTGLRGHVIDPFGGKMAAARRGLGFGDGLYKTGVRKFHPNQYVNFITSPGQMGFRGALSVRASMHVSLRVSVCVYVCVRGCVFVLCLRQEVLGGHFVWCHHLITWRRSSEVEWTWHVMTCLEI